MGRCMEENNVKNVKNIFETVHFSKHTITVAKIYSMSGLTISEMSKDLNMREEKLLELLYWLKKMGKIKDIQFC